MTVTIYVASTQPYAGKSAMCVGLLRRFQQDGYNVGYMKPVSTRARVTGKRYIDEDAHFVKYTLGLADDLDQMAPVLLNRDLMRAMLTDGDQNLAEKVQAAYQTVARGKDIMVLEGAAHLREGRIINLVPEQVVELFEAWELVVVPYEDDLQVIDDVLVARYRLGNSLIGSVINQVPEDQFGHVCEKVNPFVERRGIPVLACLPRVNTLRCATVAELAEGLEGDILCCHHMIDQLVERVMVGAMDSALAFNYFRRTHNKAVITSGDRVDLQLSALETSTRCLILTDNIPPPPMIIDRAEAVETPIILSRYDTLTTIEITEKYFGKSRFHRMEKVEAFDGLLRENMDFERFYELLGLAS